MPLGLIQKGWKAMKEMLNKRKFAKALKRTMPQAMREAGEILADEYRDAITKGKVGPRNKPLTVMIKGRDHPLLDSGKMRDAIEVDLQRWNRVLVGIPKGTPAWNVANIVSEGARIEITDRMRIMFKVLWKVSEGEIPVSRLEGRAAELWARSPGNWLPLGARRRIIRIPPRPFMQRTFKKKSTRKRMERRIRAGVVQAWRHHIGAARKKR